LDRYNLIENHGIVFSAKPNAVPYNYRISYKVSQICLVLAKSCWGKSGCSPIKLHIIAFALCSKAAMDKLISFSKNISDEPPVVRFDPAVNRAVTFGIADKLIRQSKNGKYVLTEKGKKLVQEIDNDESILVAEKAELSILSVRLTDEKIKQLSNVWRGVYAKN
jgi:hypothetical protein